MDPYVQCSQTFIDALAIGLILGLLAAAIIYLVTRPRRPR